MTDIRNFNISSSLRFVQEFQKPIKLLKIIVHTAGMIPETARKIWHFLGKLPAHFREKKTYIKVTRNDNNIQAMLFVAFNSFKYTLHTLELVGLLNAPPPSYDAYINYIHRRLVGGL